MWRGVTFRDLYRGERGITAIKSNVHNYRVACAGPKINRDKIGSGCVSIGSV